MKRLLCALFLTATVSVSAQEVDLAVLKQDNPNPVDAGGTITYTIAIGNLSATSATGVVVTDSLPETLTYDGCQTASGNGVCEHANGVVTVSYTMLAGETGDVITITAIVNCDVADGSSIVNDCAISSVENDSNPSNNNSSTTTLVSNAAPVIVCPVVEPVATDPDACTAVVTYDKPSPIDECPDETTVDCVPASGVAFALGNTTVTCTASDAAGQTSQCQFVVTVNDNQAPQVICPANILVSASDGSCEATVNYTVPTATDNCDPTPVVNCDPPPGLFTVGATTVTCVAEDNAANSASCSFTVTVADTEAPQMECPDDIVLDNDADECGAVVNYTVPAATDNCAANPVVVCVPNTGSFLPVGLTTLTCTATDSSTNSSTCTFAVTVRDAEAPVLACPENITVGTDPDSCGAVVNYTVPTATDNCDAAPVVNCDPPPGQFTVGATTVTCVAEDSATNTASCSFTVTVTDTEAPQVQCPEDIVLDNDPDACGAVVNYTVPVAVDNCTVDPVVMCAPDTGALLPPGLNTVTCTATDLAGNTSTCSFSVTINDTVSPVITCPGNITVGADTGLCSATVNYSVPTATDNCEDPVVECDPTADSVFQPGATTVTCIARDGGGNTASCTFTVTVNDTEAPVITCPTDLDQVADLDASSAVVVYPDPVVTDNCELESVECVPPSGSSFPLGATTVTCTATDAASNTSACSFHVNVIGNFASIKVLDPNGGEELPSGGTYTVKWGSPPAIAKYDVLISMNGGQTWTELASNIANTGPLMTREITVPIPPKNRHDSLLRVVGKNHLNAVVGSDVSDDPFTIEVIKVLTPNGGEELVARELRLIEWRTNQTIRRVDRVRLLASFDGGKTWQRLAEARSNRGQFNWIVPLLDKRRTECLVRVTLLDRSGSNVGTDRSDEFFTIRKRPPPEE